MIISLEDSIGVKYKTKMNKIKTLIAYIISFGVITSAWWVEYVLPEKEKPVVRYTYSTDKEILELNMQR